MPLQPSPLRARGRGGCRAPGRPLSRSHRPRGAEGGYRGRLPGGGYGRSESFRSPNGGAAGGTAAKAAASSLRAGLLSLWESVSVLNSCPHLHFPPRRWGAEVAPNPARYQLVRAPRRRRAGRGGLALWGVPSPCGCPSPGNFSFPPPFRGSWCCEAGGAVGLAVTAGRERPLGVAGPCWVRPALPSELRAPSPSLCQPEAATESVKNLQRLQEELKFVSEPCC